MPWDEFCSYVAGLMPDTPLGQIVSIRAENDLKVIRTFTPEQRKIRNDWKLKTASEKIDNEEQYMKDLEATLMRLFGAKEV